MAATAHGFRRDGLEPGGYHRERGAAIAWREALAWRVKSSSATRTRPRALEHHWSSLEGQRASSPFRPRRWRRARDGRRRDYGQAVALILGIVAAFVADGPFRPRRARK
jgi:hypothetical protein